MCNLKRWEERRAELRPGLGQILEESKVHYEGGKILGWQVCWGLP